jgi:hypothetical protein
MNDETARQLDLLAIFHDVLAGITGLFALFPLLHPAMGVWRVSSGFPEQAPKPGEAPMSREMFGWIFVAVGSVLIAFGLTLATLVVLTRPGVREAFEHA